MHCSTYSKLLEPHGQYFLSSHNCLSTVKSQFNESRFNVKSRFKVQNLVTKMEFHINKSRFSVKSRCKESKCADRAFVNRDFTVLEL